MTTRTSDSDEPIHVNQLDVALQPLRFMAFSLEGVQRTTLFDPTGRGVVVALPAPERYAVHKLLIVGERVGAFKAKVGKDLVQADALSRGPGWRKRAREGRKALGNLAPELAQRLKPPSTTNWRAKKAGAVAPALLN